MHITISRAALLQNIQRCQNIVEKRSTNAILSNLLLTAANGALEIIATDLQIGIRSRAQTQVRKEGEVTVSARKLFDIIKELNADSDVELQAESSFMEIRSGRSKFRLSTLPAIDYPGLPDNDTELTFSVDGARLANMIAATGFAMSSDETRKYLTGTLFETSPQSGLRLVATDGHRLALAESMLSQPADAHKCIVPRKTVLEIRKMAEEAEGEVSLSIGKRQVRLETGNHLLTSKVIDAQFPVYSDVIPSGNSEQALVNRTAMDQVLRRSMIVANEFTHDVRVQFSDNTMFVVACNTEQEQAEEQIDAEYSGRDITIGFNGRYLRDVLGAVNSERVRIQLKDELSPVLILEEGHDQAKYVVMPMRI